MKHEDEYKWDNYTAEYSGQLEEIKKNDNQDFFAINIGGEILDDGSQEIFFKDNLHANWKEIYSLAYKFKPKSILEVGCGACYHLKNLYLILPKETKIAGVDLLNTQIALGKEFSKLPDQIAQNLSVCDFTKEVDITEKYDFVFSQAVVMHLSTENAKAMLRNMAKVSGKYIVLVEGVKNHANWYELVRDTLPDWEFDKTSKYIDYGIVLTKREPVVLEDAEPATPHEDNVTAEDIGVPMGESDLKKAVEESQSFESLNRALSGEYENSVVQTTTTNNSDIIYKQNPDLPMKDLSIDAGTPNVVDNIYDMISKKPILLAQDTISEADMDNMADWLKTYPRLTKGKVTVEYEEQYAKSCGHAYAVFVNSGSSANLLMIDALLSTGRLNKNDKVVVPALCWITTVSPLIQLGLQPRLCDVNLDNLSVDLKHLEQIFSEQRPKCLFLVSVLGLVPDMLEISFLCKKYGVMLLIDNCEGQGSLFMGNNLEKYGLMSSCSSYFGHITSTIEGGMITTDDEELYKTLKMLRSHGWDRDVSDEEKKELQEKWNISGFNALYTFYHTGYNVRNTDLGAFVGLMQLKRLDEIVQKRNFNFRYYNDKVINNLWKPHTNLDAFVSNLGYPVLCHRRKELVAALQENNIEVRPLVSGSMGCQPFWIERFGKVQFENVKQVDEYGLYVPNNPELTTGDIDRVAAIINQFT